MSPLPNLSSWSKKRSEACFSVGVTSQACWACWGAPEEEGEGPAKEEAVGGLVNREGEAGEAGDKDEEGMGGGGWPLKRGSWAGAARQAEQGQDQR